MKASLEKENAAVLVVVASLSDGGKEIDEAGHRKSSLVVADGNLGP